MIVLKNTNGSATVDTIFRGQRVVLKPRHSLILKENEEGIAESKYLTSVYGFVIDITRLVRDEEVTE